MDDDGAAQVAMGAPEPDVRTTEPLPPPLNVQSVRFAPELSTQAAPALKFRIGLIVKGVPAASIWLIAPFVPEAPVDPVGPANVGLHVPGLPVTEQYVIAPVSEESQICP